MPADLRCYVVFWNVVDPVDLPFEVWETCLPNGQSGGCDLAMFCNCRREAEGALVCFEASYGALDEALLACEAMNAPLAAAAAVAPLPDFHVPRVRLSRWKCWETPDALPLLAPIDPKDVSF